MLGCSPGTSMFVSDGSLCIHTAQVNKRTLTNTIYDWMSRMTSETQTLGWSFLPAQQRARLCARRCLLVENKTSEMMDKAGSFKSQLHSWAASDLHWYIRIWRTWRRWSGGENSLHLSAFCWVWMTVGLFQVRRKECGVSQHASAKQLSWADTCSRERSWHSLDSLR